MVNHVQVPVISNRVCNKMYEKISNKVRLHILSDMMCAGFDVGGKDACQVGIVRSIVIGQAAQESQI